MLRIHGSVSDSLTSHHAFTLSAVVSALHQQNLPSNELGSLKTSSPTSVMEDG